MHSIEPAEPSLPEKVKVDGDPSTHFSRLGKNMFFRRTLASVGLAGGYEVAAGNGVITPSIPVYATIAVATVVTCDRWRRSKEHARVKAAEKVQEEIREELDEPLDLFVVKNGKKQKSTILRWYGDESSYKYDRAPRELPDRLRKIAEYADDNNIDEIAISEWTVINRCKRISAFLSKGRLFSSRQLTSKNGYEISDETFSPNLIALSSEELREFADAIVIPERYTTQKRTYLDEVVGRLKEHHPQHRLIALYDAWIANDNKPEGLDAIRAHLKSAIEDRMYDIGGERNRLHCNGAKNSLKTSYTAQLRGEYLSLYEATDQAEGGKRGIARSQKLLARAGHTELDKLCRTLFDDKCHPEDVAYLAEIAAWELIRTNRHTDAYDYQRSQREVDIISQRSKLPPGSTYFQRLAATSRIKHLESIRVMRESAKGKKYATALAAIGIFSFVSPALGSEVNDSRDSLHASEFVGAQQTAKVLDGINGSDANIRDATSDLWDIVSKEVGNVLSKIGGETSPGPKGGSGIDRYASGMEDHQGAASFGNLSLGFGEGEAEWGIQVPPGERIDIQGYWTAGLLSQTKVSTGRRGGRLPPFRNASLFMKEAEYHELNSSAFPLVPLRSPKDLAGSTSHLVVSGNKSVNYLHTIPYMHNGQRQEKYLLHIPIKQGTALEAAQVDKYDSGTGKRIESLPVQAIQMPDSTYRLMLPKSAAGDFDRYLKIKYWLTTDSHAQPHAALPLTDHTTSKPLNQVMTSADTQAITSALKLPPRNTPYTPAEVAEQVRTTKKYSLEPYPELNRGRGGRSKSSKNLPLNKIYRGFGEYAAKLPTEICNTATLIGVLATAGGSSADFVNVANGFYNNGDNVLITGEGHNYMIDNRGRIIDATPVGYIQPPRPEPQTTPPAKDQATEAFQKMLDGAKYPAIALGGAVLLGVGIGSSRKVLPKVIKALNNIPDNMRYSSAHALLYPEHPDVINTRHGELDELDGIVHGGAQQPQFNPNSSLHQKPLEARYRNHQGLTADSLRRYLASRRAQGWEISPLSERELTKLVQSLQTVRQ